MGDTSRVRSHDLSLSLSQSSIVIARECDNACRARPMLFTRSVLAGDDNGNRSVSVSSAEAGWLAGCSLGLQRDQKSGSILALPLVVPYHYRVYP